MNLNQSITLAMARTMQGLSDFVFVNMAKITLSTCDTYLDHLKSGIKHDTLHPSIWADFFCTVSSRKLRTTFLMITSITPVPLTRNHYSITPMLSQINRHRTPGRNHDHQPGKCSALVVRTENYSQFQGHRNPQGRLHLLLEPWKCDKVSNNQVAMHIPSGAATWWRHYMHLCRNRQ